MSPCLCIHSTALSLWRNHHPLPVSCVVCYQDCKCLYYGNCRGDDESTFALFPPPLHLEDGDSRAAFLVAANLGARTFHLVVGHAEHVDAAVWRRTFPSVLIYRSVQPLQNVMLYALYVTVSSCTREYRPRYYRIVGKFGKQEIHKL